MNQTEFAVSRFENRNGAISWRVTGWLHGLRIRRNYKTREEAAAERSVLEIKALQAAAGLRAVATVLTDDQVREAETVFRRLSGKPHPLSFYMDFALSSYREPECQKPLSAAISEYVGGFAEAGPSIRDPSGRVAPDPTEHADVSRDSAGILIHMD